MILTEKHKQILDKAERVFAEKGFEGATVRDIADAAGINLAMISYYFGSKDKLMEALFRERMEVMKLRVETLIDDKSMTPFEKVETLVDQYINRVMEKQAFYKIMLCEQIVNKNTVVLKLLKDLKLSYASLISRLMQEGQSQGIFKKDIDVVLLLTTMTGTVTQFIVNMEYYREFNDYKKMKPAEYADLVKKKLSHHIKLLFKVILGYEQ